MDVDAEVNSKLTRSQNMTIDHINSHVTLEICRISLIILSSGRISVNELEWGSSDVEVFKSIYAEDVLKGLLRNTVRI